MPNMLLLVKPNFSKKYWFYLTLFNFLLVYLFFLFGHFLFCLIFLLPVSLLQRPFFGFPYCEENKCMNAHLQVVNMNRSTTNHENALHQLRNPHREISFCFFCSIGEKYTFIQNQTKINSTVYKYPVILFLIYTCFY